MMRTTNEIFYSDTLLIDSLSMICIFTCQNRISINYYDLKMFSKRLSTDASYEGP